MKFFNIELNIFRTWSAPIADKTQTLRFRWLFSALKQVKMFFLGALQLIKRLNHDMHYNRERKFFG